uniref:Gag-like protein n=1 Tax=Takifugu rubripes TaxID=31033 RepID=Q76IM8_TAKRU|nr:gag-like protein [Takifugu rubripes]
MNRAVVLFLGKVEQVNTLVETGITVGGQFVQVTPLTQPAARITLSNMPPFISDEFLVRELSRHGKVVSPIRKMLSGCKSPLLRHVVSHRRQVHMILNNKADEFNYRFIVRVDDFDYTLFASALFASALKCFNCREEGHLARACPSRVAPDTPAAEPATPAPAGPVAPQPVPAARRRWLSAEESSAAPDGAVAELRGGGSGTSVSGGSEIVEMVVEMNGESGESRGKVDLTVVVSDLSGVMIDGVCDLNELEKNGEVMGETEKMGEAGETGDTIQTGKLGGVSQVMGELGVPGIAAGELGEEAVSTGELGEEAVSTGERGEGAVSTCEGGEGVVSTGDGAVSAGEGASGMSEWWLVPAKRRNKHKCAMKDKGDTKTGQLEDATDGTDTSDCESMSDCSSLSGTMPDGHENNLYPPSMLKNFLTQTKGMKGLNLEKHFPDMLLFVHSASHLIKHRATSDLTNPEIFRLKKHMGKARKQLKI